MKPELTIPIPEIDGKVSALLEIPRQARALLVLAHGAGAGMNHPGMQKLAEQLQARSVGTLRFQFPYMECGSKRPDSPKIAMATIAAVVQMAARKAPKLPLYAGGRSFGGRMTTNAAANGLIGQIQGIVCFAFPLHPAKEPGVSRAEHLSAVKLPVLFIQGTRDDLADLKLLRKVIAANRGHDFRLQVIEGADHSFAVLKSSGRSNEEALSEVADATSKFCCEITGRDE